MIKRVDYYSPTFKSVKEEFTLPESSKELAEEYIRSLIDTMID